MTNFLSSVHPFLPHLLAALYILYAGVSWRLRGGALSYFLGVDVGTQPTRFICGLMLAAPLALWLSNWWLLLISPSLFVGLMAVGWGPFMAMNDGTPNDSPGIYSSLLNWVGLPIGVSVWRDIIGMAICGFVVMVPTAALFGALTYLHMLSMPLWYLTAPAGIVISPIYWMWSKMPLAKVPVIPHFLTYNNGSPVEWAEFTTGLWLGGALLGLFGLI